MKTTVYSLVAGLSFLSSAVEAGETANARFWCTSLRFERGYDRDGSRFLDLTTLSSGINGELSLDFFNSGYTHSTYLGLTDNTLAETFQGALAMDVPDGGDADNDGFADFFQVDHGVTNLTSQGAYDIDVYGQGSLTATWNRPAGSKDGNCTLNLKINAGLTFTFVHSFQLLEYTGPLEFTP